LWYTNGEVILCAFCFISKSRTILKNCSDWLNERQKKVVKYAKEKGRIVNKEYQELTGISKPTASRDLANLVDKNVLEQIGITGKGTQYILKGS